MVSNDEILLAYQGSNESDRNIHLFSFIGSSLNFDFEFGRIGKEEVLVDVIKASDGGYVLLADVEIDGKNQATIIRLNQHGEMVANNLDDQW